MVMPMLLPARRLVYLLLATLVVACANAPLPAPAVAPEEPRDFNVLGQEDAPVTVIEFTDLQCPFCARFALSTFPRLKQAYVDTGKVRYASRDLPLPMHPQAVPAAVAARCAGEQGKFWEYRHAVFAAQDKLGTQPWDELARKLGLDLEHFAACRADGRQLREVRTDATLAASHGLDTTPSFVVGRLVNGEFVGETFAGAGSYEAFAARIDPLLQ
jgi:protein-disulfide isomerase